MRAVITVLDSINPTTMPYNEFILYRNKHCRGEQQIVLLTGNEISIPVEQIPPELEIHKVGKNPFALHAELKNIKARLEKEGMSYIIHLHSIRGSFSTLLGMTGVFERSRTVYTIHSTFSGYKVHNKLISSIDSLMSSYTTCVSNSSYNAFPSFIKRIKGNRVFPLTNGLNIERVDEVIKKQEIKEKTEDVVFAYVARLIPIKNHRFLIDVIKHLKCKCKFLFIGAEDEKHAIREYAKECGVMDKIEFTGLIEREKVYERLLEADVYVSTSVLEGLPISVLEGMYSGLPVILSDIPQHREIAMGNDFISIVDYDIFKWVQEIQKYCEMSGEERKVVGEKCKKLAVTQFSLEKMHKRYSELYEKIERELISGGEL